QSTSRVPPPRWTSRASPTAADHRRARPEKGRAVLQLFLPRPAELSYNDRAPELRRLGPQHEFVASQLDDSRLLGSYPVGEQAHRDLVDHSVAFKCVRAAVRDVSRERGRALGLASA